MIEVEAGRGVRGNGRYFGRTSRSTGKVLPDARSASFRGSKFAEHAAALGLEVIGPGVVRSNIETSGIDLLNLIGCQVRVGSAVLYFYEPRTPCAKMDAICAGLRAFLMENNRQGVMAEVIQSVICKSATPFVLCVPSI